jgi:hypothetical protein
MIGCPGFVVFKALGMMKKKEFAPHALHSLLQNGCQLIEAARLHQSAALPIDRILIQEEEEYQPSSRGKRFLQQFTEQRSLFLGQPDDFSTKEFFSQTPKNLAGQG